MAHANPRRQSLVRSLSVQDVLPKPSQLDQNTVQRATAAPCMDCTARTGTRMITYSIRWALHRVSASANRPSSATATPSLPDTQQTSPLHYPVALNTDAGQAPARCQVQPPAVMASAAGPASGRLLVLLSGGVGGALLAHALAPRIHALHTQLLVHTLPLHGSTQPMSTRRRRG